jgi:hypothetical protein
MAGLKPACEQEANDKCEGAGWERTSEFQIFI